MVPLHLVTARAALELRLLELLLELMVAVAVVKGYLFAYQYTIEADHIGIISNPSMIVCMTTTTLEENSTASRSSIKLKLRYARQQSTIP